MTRAGHCVVVDDGDWFDDGNHDDNIGNYCNDDNHDDNRRKEAAVAVLKTEPVAAAVADAAEAAEAAEAAAVATAGVDNNQQRAAKTVAAVIAVGKRRQARGEKWWWGQRRGRRQRRCQQCRCGEARGEGRDQGSTYANWRLFGAK